MKTRITFALFVLTSSVAVAVEPWTIRQKLTPSDGAAYSYFGHAVALRGGLAAIGSPEAGSMGAAYVFHENAGIWQEVARLLPLDGFPNDDFGKAVAVSAGVVVVGAPGDQVLRPIAGAVYVYGDTGGNWAQVAKLTASDGSGGDHLGWSVAATDTTIIAGAPFRWENGHNLAGAAYVFEPTDTGWAQVAKLAPPDPFVRRWFGKSIAIEGNTAVVGAPSPSSPAVYVFRRTDGEWDQVAKLTPSDGGRWSTYGWSVAIEGETIVVGARDDDDVYPSSGSVYVYRHDQTGWTETAKLLAPQVGYDDYFGTSVSLSDGLLFVGASGDDDAGYEAGAVYLFEETDGNWSPVDKLLPPGIANGNIFGWSVATDGGLALISAPNDSPNGPGSGSAYVYVPEPATVSLLALWGLALLRRKRGCGA